MAHLPDLKLFIATSDADCLEEELFPLEGTLALIYLVERTKESGDLQKKSRIKQACLYERLKQLWYRSLTPVIATTTFDGKFVKLEFVIPLSHAGHIKKVDSTVHFSKFSQIHDQCDQIGPTRVLEPTRYSLRL